MVPVFLSGPASAMDHETVTITGNILLVTYDIAVTGIGQSTAIVTWNTNGNADSTVEYGTTTSYGSISIVGGMTESHTITISGFVTGHGVPLPGDIRERRWQPCHKHGFDIHHYGLTDYHSTHYHTCYRSTLPPMAAEAVVVAVVRTGVLLQRLQAPEMGVSSPRYNQELYLR